MESVIAALPGVRACVVLPVASLEYGQAPVAFVESDRPEQELRGALDARLPRRLRPAQWVVCPELPRTVAGKLARAALRDLLEAEPALSQ
ncbi:hypothetical protein LAJ19_06325 [Deinococcus taeanensis]|uniref:AMP-binding enzyme n=1 Tax=Deinococcus taeanensis TaxID=2737050 RepID=UPI001CDBC565|nr:hypothetical protein LAJ19_06325 [Deinococcus taeanensis]